MEELYKIYDELGPLDTADYYPDEFINPINQ